MVKHTHEIRCPVHGFVHIDKDERRVLDSRPFQRLRDIHQLAMTYLVYPAATHKRFEHSLGVMELAGRVYDVITDLEHVLHDEVREVLPKYNEDEHRYWRRATRMAALCHDIGHLPFSHAAEDQLLPSGMKHEDITRLLISSDEMNSIWSSMRPPLNKNDIVKLALGKKKLKDIEFSLLEAVLSEIITGDAFGVDRIDYLLRDSLHTGVGYGKFDHFRLVETLRILPKSKEDQEPTLGIEEGGVFVSESLVVARYFMFSQMYFHPVRRAYDKHLQDFMISYLGQHGYPVDPESHLAITDHVVLAKLTEAVGDPSHLGHEPAQRISNRDHYKVAYSRNPIDQRVNPAAASYVAKALKEKIGESNVYLDQNSSGGGSFSFPILLNDRRIVDSASYSGILRETPSVASDYVFVPAQLKEKSVNFINDNRDTIIMPAEEA